MAIDEVTTKHRGGGASPYRGGYGDRRLRALRRTTTPIDSRIMAKQCFIDVKWYICVVMLYMGRRVGGCDPLWDSMCAIGLKYFWCIAYFFCGGSKVRVGVR